MAWHDLDVHPMIDLALEWLEGNAIECQGDGQIIDSLLQ